MSTTNGTIKTPLLIHLDWNVIVRFAHNDFLDLKSYLSKLQSKGTIFTPYTEAHLMEAHTIKSGGGRTKQENIQKHLDSLSEVSKDLLWNRASHELIHIPVSIVFGFFSQLGPILDFPFDDDDYGEQCEIRDKRLEVGLDPSILNNLKPHEVVETLNDVMTTPEFSKTFYDEESKIQTLEAIDHVHSTLPEMLRKSMAQIPVELDASALNSALQTTLGHLKDAIMSGDLGPVPGASFQEQANQITSLSRDVLGQFQELVREAGIDVPPEGYPLPPNVLADYHLFQGMGYSSDPPRRGGNLQRSLLADSAHCSIAAEADIHITRDKRHCNRTLASFARQNVKVPVVHLDNAMEELPSLIKLLTGSQG